MHPVRYGSHSPWMQRQVNLIAVATPDGERWVLKKPNAYLIAQTVLNQQAPEVCKGDLVAFLAALPKFLFEFAEVIWE